MNGSSINHGLMKTIQNLYIKGRSLNCNIYRIQAKLIQCICTIEDIELIDILGTRSRNFLRVKLMS
jgi:hypothetical protein